MDVRFQDTAALPGVFGADGGGAGETFAHADRFVDFEGIGIVHPTGEIPQSGGFGLVKAGERPTALGEVFNGEIFAAGAGFVDLAQFGKELLVEGGFFAAEDSMALDGKAVLAGVLGRGGFALGGAGSGAALRVAAVLRNEPDSGFRLPDFGFRG